MNKNLRKKVTIIAVTALVVQAGFIPTNGALAAEKVANSNIELSVNTTKEVKAGALQYALFSGSENSDFIYSGWKMTVNGDIHTNSNFISQCSELYVTGKCQAAKDMVFKGWKKEIGQEVKGADIISMDDIGDKILDHVNKEDTTTHGNGYNFHDHSVNLEKDIVVKGNVAFHNSELVGNGFIVADNISFNLDQFKNDSDTSVCYYAKNGDIVINANNSELNGILYAPNGKVIFNGYNLKLNGRIIADQIILNGSLININAGDSDLDVFDKINQENPGEENPGEENPGEENPGEENPGEENPGEENPGEDKPEEDKPEENKGTENPNPSHTEYGDATEEDGIIELTPLEQYKKGAVWLDDTVDTTNGFELNFEYWAGGGREYYFGGADGIVVNLAAEKKDFGKTSGGALSFNGSGTYGIEFDSYQNAIDPEYWTKGFKHVAIIKDKVSNHLTYKVDDRVDDSQWHKVKVVYKENSLYVYLDDEKVLESGNIELNNDIFVGFTGTTGQSINRQLIKKISYITYNK